MWVVVAVVMGAVLFLASKGKPVKTSSGDLPPNTLLPGTGNSAVQSPATTGPNPLGTNAGKVLAFTVAPLARVLPGARSVFTVPPPASTDSSPTDKQLTTVTRPTLPGGSRQTYRKL